MFIYFYILYFFLFYFVLSFVFFCVRFYFFCLEFVLYSVYDFIVNKYDPDRPDGRLNLTASTFNQLGRYTSSPGRSGYCYAELAVFSPSGGRNHHQYSLRLPTEGWPG